MGSYEDVKVFVAREDGLDEGLGGLGAECEGAVVLLVFYSFFFARFFFLLL